MIAFSFLPVVQILSEEVLGILPRVVSLVQPPLLIVREVQQSAQPYKEEFQG